MRRLRRAVLDPATLLPHILHFGHRPGTDDPRVAASHWTDAAQLPPDIPPATDLATPHVQIGAEPHRYALTQARDAIRCLRYRLETPRHCSTCPLVSPALRLALLRERLEDGGRTVAMLQ
jgi:hypothetical protein